VYEINGEEKVIEDALIFKYSGQALLSSGGIAINTWKESLKSGNNRVILLKIDEENVIYYPTRNQAKYYMGESSKPYYYGEHRELDYVSGIYVSAGIANPEHANVYDKYVGVEELFDKYNIRIISFEIAPPITNSFK